MLTLDLKIKSISNPDLIINYISDYTKLFFNLYNNFDLSSSKDFIQFNLKDSLLDASIFHSCKIDVQTKLKQLEVIKLKKEKQIIELTNYLNNTEFIAKNEKRSKYKLINKLAYLKRTKDKNICFGGKALLREITKLKQKENKTAEQILLLERKQTEFKEKRSLGIYLVGNACERGNRKINFDLANNKIVFKPNKDTKIDIEFYVNGKKQLETLKKLQSYSENKLIPLTVRILKDRINISYDEQLLNGYGFNEKECKNEQSLHIDKEVKKQIYIKYKKEQEEKWLVNKIKDRYLAVDLNPNYIGISIFDNNVKTNEQKIILTECISLVELNKKSGLKSESNKQKSINNKRKFEICEAWKYIFDLCKHYKVYNFVLEDLDFKPEKQTKAKEFNRITKNLWNRELQINLINKYCNSLGINKIEVNPCYSSFIGNMIHPYFDPISSSLEIGRRGVVKYKKGSSIYPELASINQEKLTYLLGENVVDKGNISWKQLYGIISLLRYRNQLEQSNGKKDKYLRSRKSKLILIKQ